jgi:hypothetical protein
MDDRVGRHRVDRAVDPAAVALDQIGDPVGVPRADFAPDGPDRLEREVRAAARRRRVDRRADRRGEAGGPLGDVQADEHTHRNHGDGHSDGLLRQHAHLSTCPHSALRLRTP